ncbi:facilitated trehalose transporter Tret1-2 homolog [Drosophila guanche]|uniref:Blast:Facilitated trehalose transporter Tret1-2 homolog n=1 Tax=Drosophila guanche TaxID=7266 RepID=A0A3B0J2B3_DROGU|nr:facilitated trehalose transporter Tret1-2 homolog [Drosophila guanche]SPP75257.1 blast:Facilitated trehalose transporter Tret1-2 homolog [Drosophila guanche]
MSKGSVLPQYIAGLSASFGALCMGASIGWSSPVEQMITDDSDYGFDISSSQFGWISALLTLGATVVCIPIGFMIDWIGRRPTMLALIPPYMVGWVLMLFANNVTMLYFGRFILGMCGGAFCVTAPMYCTEISTTALRGTIGSFFQLLIVTGVFYGYVLGAFLPLTTINILCSILPLIFAAVHFFMPESPVYLAKKGRNEDTAKALQWLRGKDADISDELKEILDESQRQNDQPKINFMAALRRPVTRKGLGISVLLQVFQQWTGINAILFYSTSIFEDVGAGLTGSMSTILIGVTQTATTVVAVAIIDKSGRRNLLLISGVLMAITTCLMGVYFQMSESNPDSVVGLGWLPIVSICIFIVFFSIGFGPVPWLVMAEVFSEDIKSLGGSIAGTSNWLSAFMVTLLFPILKDSIGPGPTFWIFTVIAVLSFFYALFFVPETKGKTILEIQDMLAGGKTQKADKNET